MKVSVIIPSLNEAASIGKVIDEIKALPRGTVAEIIVVDGDSPDGTAKIAQEHGARVIRQTGRGYGAAFIEGIKNSKGEVVVLMDADGSHDPKDIPLMLDKIRDGYDYVMASRYAPGARSEDDWLIRYIGNKFFTWLTNLLHGTKVTDSLYLYTAIKKDKLDEVELKSRSFEFCTEILVKCHRAGLKFGEVAAVERKRQGDKTKVNALRDGVKILWVIVKLKFS